MSADPRLVEEPERVEVTDDLVRSLLVDQHPDLAHLPLTLSGSGWDNCVWRLGDELTVRLPIRAASAPLIDHEQRWLSDLVADLPSPDDGGLATSAPLRSGAPGLGYPWRWSIGPWIPGDVWAAADVVDPVDAGTRLGRFLHAFHRPAPPDAAANPHRGVPLADRLDPLAEHLAQMAERGRSLPEGVTEAAVAERLRHLAATPAWTGPPLWLHGDPHALNLIVDGGCLRGIIDFGDLTSGDPASDLTPRWLVLPPEGRGPFVDQVGVDADTWRRAEGWAIALAVAYQAGAPDRSPLIGWARRGLAELFGVS